jgi:hypothetical protein
VIGRLRELAYQTQPPGASYDCTHSTRRITDVTLVVSLADLRLWLLLLLLLLCRGYTRKEPFANQAGGFNWTPK